jgi:CheY-like chemotaxis protein
MPDDITKGGLAGFSHYLTKPISVGRLLEVIDDILS